MRAQSMLVVFCVLMLAVVLGCDTKPAQTPPADTPAPEESAPAVPVEPEAAAPSTDVSAAAAETVEAAKETAAAAAETVSAAAENVAAIAEEAKEAAADTLSTAAESVAAAAEEAKAAVTEALDMAAAEVVFTKSCTSCHKADKVEAHAKAGLAEQPWDAVVKERVEEKGAKITPKTRRPSSPIWKRSTRTNREPRIALVSLSRQVTVCVGVESGCRGLAGREAYLEARDFERGAVTPTHCRRLTIAQRVAGH